MTRHIQAYFSTEDKVEGARLSLLPFEVEQVEAGYAEDGLSDNDRIRFPFLPVNTGGASGATGANVGNQGAVPLPGTIREGTGALPGLAVAGLAVNEPDDEELAQRGNRENEEPRGDVNPDDLKYVLSAKVKEHDYEEIVKKLRGQGAYISDL
ncbi:hypothetical protein [Paenibacillus senegalimassiliensis]|uniref:hypothetical protein n=1 Tax=Paenibacillus senegalimassiliensis TaxID=1737426 RepID=UPI00073E9806|nr:hypothetical protein [Paenibacillus senegalimassiliensis]